MGYSLTKRLFDIIFGLLSIILCIPFGIIISILIKYESKGPVLFYQTRIGKDGLGFRLYHFRTMYYLTSNELQQLSNKQEVLSESDRLYRLGFTRIGKFLRKYSLDELPQLFNVVNGDMSFVGPRPSLPYEYERLDESYKKRTKVKPGLVGLWLLHGRGEVKYNSMMDLDLNYIENMSFSNDTLILLKSIAILLRGTGAL